MNKERNTNDFTALGKFQTFLKVMNSPAISIIIAICLFQPCVAQSPNKADLLISNVNLIDGTGSDLQENVYVYIKDGIITDISLDELDTQAEQMIDGTNKYLIPGFFDNHVHIGSENKWPLVMSQFIHFGITSVLIPGANNQKLLEFKEDLNTKKLTVPNLYHTSLMTTMEGKHPAKTYGADGYIDGVNINYVKDTTSIKPIIAQAVKDEAIALKLMIEDGPQPPFVARIPEEYVTMLSKEAHAAGLDFFAHVSDMYEVRTAVNNQADALMHFMGVRIDWEKDMELMQEMVDQDISWVSTGMIGKSFFHSLNKQWLENEHYAIFSEDQIDYFKDKDGALEAESRAILTGLFGSDKIPFTAIMTSMMKDFKKLYDMGINTVVGTDLGGRPYIVPGYSFHEEMELFQMGGFTPLQIIQCATLNAAKMLKVDDRYGSIEVGKYADFVLLAENPLLDIRNALSIDQVYKEGVLQQRITK